MAGETDLVLKEDDPDEIPDLKPFEGKLVEITGVEGKIEPESSEEGALEPLDINGIKGRVLEWIADADKYAVESFSGEVIPVSEENLLEYDPPDPEDGGFDLCWYSQANSLDSGMFAAMMASHLEKKGCCVVQTFLGGAGCQQAMDIANQLQYWSVMGPEYQQEYLGREEVAEKTAWLYNDGVFILNMDEFEAVSGSEASSALELCDQTFTCIASHLFPYAPNFEDAEQQFTPWGRTNGLVRMSFGSSEEKSALDVKTMTEEAELEAHSQLSESKKLCMMYLIDAEGGSLTLHAEAGDVVIPLQPNQSKVVVFREDQMSYSYAPTGRHLALQAWLVDEPQIYKDQVETLRNIDGPEEPPGQRINIMSMQTEYPGNASDPDAAWCFYFAGTDGQQHIPPMRWDVDVYYRNVHTPGYSMSNHGSFLTDAEITSFDNTFFNFDEKYTKMMPPHHRINSEIGYQVLHSAGFRREMLKGAWMGVFTGDSGSDFTQMQLGGRMDPRLGVGMDKLFFENSFNCAAAGRLSWLFGMVGPVSTAETACSSSLVATGVAHMHMRWVNDDQIKTSMNQHVKQSLVLGTNTLVGAGSYIFLSGPGMLTHEGRCFTFNASADGYARGEGGGGLFMRTCSNSLEAMGRLAMMIGSCVNQDGRSASMTAPHGPSQSEVIKASMTEAGLMPNMVSIAECHGTGTALGDPIEIGSLKAIMSKGRGDSPLLTTSAKSNLGHLECGAGMCGILKCVLMLRHSIGVPNNHLCEINPHLDIDGFPIGLEVEGIDFGCNSGLTGVSSFGFGGTNARIDLWGHSVVGQRSCMSGSVMKLRTVFM